MRVEVRWGSWVELVEGRYLRWVRVACWLDYSELDDPTPQSINQSIKISALYLYRWWALPRKEWNSDEIKEVIGVYETHTAIVWCFVHLTRNRKETTQFTTPFFLFFVFPIFIYYITQVQHTAVGPCLSYEYPRQKIISFESALLTCLIKHSEHASENFRWILISATPESDIVLSGGHALWKFYEIYITHLLSSGHAPESFRWDLYVSDSRESYI